MQREESRLFILSKDCFMDGVINRYTWHNDV